jgi:DNA replication protein DnaC
MNRNTKRYPKEEINRLKKSGKRLRGGYVLTRLKNWKKRKATAKRVSVDLPATEIVPPKKSIRRPFDRVKRGIKKRQRSKIARERLMYWKGGKKEEPKAKVKNTGKIVDIVKKDNKPDVLPKSKETKKVTAPRPKKATVSKVKNTGKIVDIVKKDSKPDVLPKTKIEKIERVLPERKERAKKNDLIVETIKKADKPQENKSLKPYSLIKLGENTHTGNKFLKIHKKNPIDYVRELNDQWENRDKARDFKTLLRVIDWFELDESNYPQGMIDFVEYCMLSSRKMLGEKANKETIQLLKNVKDKKFFDEVYLFPYGHEMNINQLIPRVKDQRIIQKINLDMFEKIVSAFASDDENRPSMLGVFYNYSKQEIVLTDTYKLIVIPVKYFDNSIINKLHKDSITAYKVKNKKNWEKIDEIFVNYEWVIPESKNLKIASYMHIDTELDKINQLEHMMKFSQKISKSKSFVKFSKDGEHFASNFMYLKQCLETLKMFGLDTAVMQRMKENGNRRPHIFMAEDIKILLSPIAFEELYLSDSKVSAFDPYYYDFSNPNNDSANLPFFDGEEYISLYTIKEKLDKFCEKRGRDKSEKRSEEENEKKAKELSQIRKEIREGGMSDDVAELSLYDDIDPNINAGEEIKAIASDIPAFGDDIREEQLELDSKLDLPDVQQNRNNMEIASAKDIRTMKFKAITLPSKYRQLLGKVPSNFRLLLWGAPGHGKSSLALTIANDIGKYVKTLYVSAEESLQSATLASRIKRFKATARNLMFNDTNNPEIIEKIILTQNPKFIVIDSVNVMIGKTEAMINLMLKYPDIGFILIAQATKDRKRYAGLGSLAHAVDIVVNVKSGVATAEKNRYSQLGSMPVKGIKI